MGHTRFDISMRIRAQVAILDSFLTSRDLVVHQRLILLVVLIHLLAGASLRFRHSHGDLRVRVFALSSDSLRFAGGAGAALHSVLMHRSQGRGDPQHQHHESLFGKSGMIDQVGVDGILQVSTLVVGQQDVDGLRAGVASVRSEFGARLRRNAVVYRVDDILLVCEQVVGLHLFQGLGDGLLAERTSDFLQRKQLGRGLVLYEVDVGKTTLSCSGVSQLSWAIVQSNVRGQDGLHRAGAAI